MTTQDIFKQIVTKKSFLCVGLDSDINKLPQCLKNTTDTVFAFNKTIVDATAKYSIAYKPNLAFYESNGISGWQSLEKTVNYIKQNYPEIFLIADAKRGDIGNTSKMYAQAFFEKLPFDAVTVAPYMGEDSVSPFLTYKDKFVILLALTSNKGANDFQFFENNMHVQLFEQVLKTSQNWANSEQMMYVVGATRAEMLADVRKIVPNHFLLVPGVGAQGGSLSEVAKFGMNEQCGLIVNSSRAIIFADSTDKFSQRAEEEAHKVQVEMRELLKEKNIV
ncbi:MAG: orotidine-5'-phosphate decarboxylase [Bacteroidetes bacterium CG_4_10_14_3_um_filter_31_20]|nr:MAG: orotidine-5'-phosphate decarboxylase [Bacteroidetes bacterium CG_4_10_14_3_um_filter_31_20]